MYDIINIVYGFKYTKEIEAALAVQEGCTVAELDPTNFGWLGFEFAYTGHVPDVEPGWWGEKLAEMPSWEITVEKFKALEVPPDVKAKVDEGYVGLPDWLRNVAPEPSIVEVWSTS